MDKLNNMQVFCRIVELGTFAAVAREMDLSAMMISKYIAPVGRVLGRGIAEPDNPQAQPDRSWRGLLQSQQAVAGRFFRIGRIDFAVRQECQRYVKGQRFNRLWWALLSPSYRVLPTALSRSQIMMTLHNSHVNLSEGRHRPCRSHHRYLGFGRCRQEDCRNPLVPYASPAYIRQFGEPKAIDDLKKSSLPVQHGHAAQGFWISGLTVKRSRSRRLGVSPRITVGRCVKPPRWGWGLRRRRSFPWQVISPRTNWWKYCPITVYRF